MIEVKNLVKRYGNQLALADLSFTVENGKVYGLLGANGAGKSTTMNIITGYIGATSGTVEIDGLDILKNPEMVKSKIGYLPEQPPLYLDMKVEEYLSFCGELKKIPHNKRLQRMEEVIDKVQLGDVRQRLIKNLSKGYKQRVGLAQAIMGYPEVIILDEPTVGLDPQQIIEIRSLIRELAEEHTIIFSSHILAEVQEVCDEFLIMAKGKLVVKETTDNIGSLMNAPLSIELTIKTTPALAEKILAELPQIERADYQAENETTKIHLQMKDQTDIREELFLAFAKEQIAILEIQQSTTSLEDVFLELIQDPVEAVEELTGETATDLETAENKDEAGDAK
ncbi:ABC transporter ATP-binding protein [Enterococcus sp. HY326]|uniref:ABC transporter ATP-binding protein n=1 Tax=Enterococcus sp. HY326 TaxID=2971265 RepID=UPI00223FF0E4|nr:ABC transporter ATP-binding protein [Enterococcus sp. HY326]